MSITVGEFKAFIEKHKIPDDAKMSFDDVAMWIDMPDGCIIDIA